MPLAHSKVRHWCLVVVLTCVQLGSSCSSEPKLKACASDLDCKGARVCEEGGCVDPNSENNATVADAGSDVSTNNGTNNGTTNGAPNNESNNQAESGCINVIPEGELSFGLGGIGYASELAVTIENCSETFDLAVSEISTCTFVDDGVCETSSPVFGIKNGSLPASLPADDAIIGPLESAGFVLTYSPEDLSVSSGELMVRSNDPAKANLVVPIVGQGTNNACPQAVAEAKLSDGTRWQTDLNTIPLKTINFRGTNSTDQDGTIVRYEWNIVSQPTNSTSRMTPSADVAETSLFLDLAGEYTIELTVYDDNDAASCGDPSLVTLRAVPNEDVHIQLVWDTPTDAVQTDSDGTDLDLHVLHPNGRWNAAPYDVYWLNPTADWGTPGPTDDPSLDIDDTDGAGPENFNMDDPEAGLAYAVGAYYYDDKGFGPSYATIRIYIRGTQEYEFRDMYLPSMGTFWYAATIAWPSADIFGVNDLQQGFPTTP